MATELIHSMKPSGGDYTSPVTWESQVRGDLTSTARLVFSHGGVTGSLAHGDSVTGNSSGATGTIIGAVTSSQIYISVLTGTFSSGEQIYKTLDTDYVISSDAGDTAQLTLQIHAGNYTGIHNGGDGFIRFDPLFITGANGWVASATNYPHVMMAPESTRHAIPRGGFYWQTDGFFEQIMQVLTPYVRVTGFHFWTPVGGNASYDPQHQLTGSYQIYKNCIFESAAENRCMSTSGRSSQFINCIFIKHPGTGESPTATGSNTNVEFYNCLFVGGTIACDDGTNTSTFANTMINCCAYNNRQFVNIGAQTNATRNNATSRLTKTDGSYNFPSERSNVENPIRPRDFVDPDNFDFRLTPWSSLRGAGSPIPEITTTDFFGRPRTEWSIGPFEYHRGKVINV